MINKFKIIFCLLIILIIFGIFRLNVDKPSFVSNSLPKQTHEVILTIDGFSPQEITLNKGDAIKFTTSLGKPFWPASNLHPTHTIYPEFDPKEPVAANKDWSFVFNKSGEWKFHDHLSPIFKGKVTVLERKLPPKDLCVDGGDKLKCYEDIIDTALKNQGLKEAFEVLAGLFEKDPHFASSCHDFVHKLGEKAYILFSEKKDFQLSKESSYCGYGFYHGFMETLLLKTGDMDEARRFCEYVDTQLKKTTSDAIGACFHGIGHGAVDGSDPKAWGNPQAMINTGLKLCEMVSNDENPPPRYGKLYRCVSGAFNGLEIFSTTNQYKLSLNKEDPFWVCRTQPESYKESCFTQFVVAAMNIKDNNFVQVVEIIDTIKEDDYAIPSVQAMVVEFVRLGKTNHKQTLNFCRNLPGRFQIPCITAFAEGFLKYGPPEKEYIEALKFCNSPLLSEFEKSACFTRVLSLLRIWYTAVKSHSICLEVDQKYRWQNCQYN